MKTKTKTLTLTVEQWDIILDAVCFYRDCGPEGEGWKSVKLSNAYDILRDVFEEAKVND